jgi:hypothetical protein
MSAFRVNNLYNRKLYFNIFSGWVAGVPLQFSGYSDSDDETPQSARSSRMKSTPARMFEDQLIFVPDEHHDKNVEDG